MPRRTLTPEEFELLRSADLGSRLRLFRKEIGKLHTDKAFTTVAISERIGVKHQTIISIERGDSKKPAYQLMHKITQDLGLPFDSLTDDFYEGPFRPIAIGEPAGNDDNLTETGTEIARTSVIGAVLYEYRSDKTVRLIHDLRSYRPLNKPEFISALARLISEFQATETVEKLYTQPHPVIVASELYNALAIYPQAYPSIPEDALIKARNELIATYQPEGDNERS
ncbi:helix-turn-helix transcriptional regulator [Paenibacillus septentrionalis]|uniref:Helix-turn-helix transcriptional regulator n=1 Tax=Paenibacillus septentrionalis TaxID=429342 RepID=A0ABW1V9H5_9BACL